MVEITCGLKAPHRLSADCADFEKRSLDYTVKRKLMAAGSGMVLKGFAFGMALGGLTSGPTGLCRSAKFVAEIPAIDRSRGEVRPA